MVEKSDDQPHSADGDDLKIRHAVIVLNRLIRSKRPSDVALQDRLFRAAKIAQVATNSETALVSGRPADAVYRIASRIVRNMSSGRRTNTN